MRSFESWSCVQSIRRKHNIRLDYTNKPNIHKHTQTHTHTRHTYTYTKADYKRKQTNTSLKSKYNTINTCKLTLKLKLLHTLQDTFTQSPFSLS